MANTTAKKEKDPEPRVDIFTVDVFSDAVRDWMVERFEECGRYKCVKVVELEDRSKVSFERKV